MRKDDALPLEVFIFFVICIEMAIEVEEQVLKLLKFWNAA